MTVVRSKSHGVQVNGDTMFWGTKIIGPPDSEVKYCQESVQIWSSGPHTRCTIFQSP